MSLWVLPENIWIFAASLSLFSETEQFSGVPQIPSNPHIAETIKNKTREFRVISLIREYERKMPQ